MLRPGCGIQVLPPALLQVLCVILVQSVRYSLYVSFPSLLPGCLTPPLFAWCLCFCCSPCAALIRAWRAPAGASPVLSPLDRTPTCCPCLLPAVTHGGALGLPEVGTGRAGTTAGAGSGASPCTTSATETMPRGWVAVGI